MIQSTGCSNRLTTLAQLKGEVVKGVFAENDEDHPVIYVIFESGYALAWSNTNGSFWLTGKDDVRRKLVRVKDQASKMFGELKNLLELAGECAP